MKVALCLSGQPRSVDRGYPSIYKNFIEPYDCDVFVHTWSDGFPPENIQRIQDLYHPVSMHVDPCHPPIYDYNRLHYAYGPKRIYDMCSQYDSIFRANALRNKYEAEKNVHYDCVIRCRMDLDFSSRIYLENYNLDMLHTRLQNVCRYNGLQSDFAFSKGKNMDAYATCIYNILPIYSKLHEENPLCIPPHIMLASEIILGQTIRYIHQIPVEEHLDPEMVFDIIR